LPTKGALPTTAKAAGKGQSSDAKRTQLASQIEATMSAYQNARDSKERKRLKAKLADLVHQARALPQ
jgi:hypothetical protein